MTLAISLIFAFSKTFWSESIIAEVYTLNAFFVILTLYILFIWQIKRFNKYLYILSLIYGLSLTNHHAMVLLGPIYIIFIIISDKTILKNHNVLLKMFILFIIGISIYLYLPVRAVSNPSINWGNPSNLGDLFYHISRSQYGALNVNPRSFSLLFNQILSFLKTIPEQFSYLVLFGILGVMSFFRKRTYFLITFLIFLASIALIFLVNFEINLKSLKTMEPFYIPSYMMIVIWIGAGVVFISNKSEKLNIKILKYSLNFLFCFLFIIPFKNNYFENNLSRNYVAYDFNANILKTIDRDSVLFVNGDNVMFPLVYLQKVEIIRKDITIYDDIGCVFKNIYGNNFLRLSEQDKKIRRNDVQLSILKTTDKQIYYVLGSNLSNIQGIKSKPTGLVYKIDRQVTKFDNKDLWQIYKMRGIDDKKMFKDYLNRDLIAQYYFFKGEYYFSVNDKENALEEYKKSSSVGYDMEWVKNNIGLALNIKNLSEEAEKQAEEAIKINPKNSLAYVNLGLIYFKKGLNEKAIEFYKRAIEIDSNCVEAYSNNGVVYEKIGSFDKAVEEYKKAILLDQNHYDSHYNLGVVYSKQGKYDESIIELEKSIKINPDLVEGYISIGVVYGRIGEFDKAIKLLNKAIKINPLSIDAYNNLTVAYIKIKDIKKAEECCRKVLSIESDNQFAKRNMKYIEKIKR